jgi:hypothetical protein
MRTAQRYPDPLRHIHYFDAEKDSRLIFLTNKRDPSDSGQLFPLPNLRGSVLGQHLRPRRLSDGVACFNLLAVYKRLQD